MIEACTFRPLSRGRYRCVQTRALVSKAQVQHYRFRRQRENLPKRERRQEPEPMSVRMSYSSQYIECPSCEYVTYVGVRHSATCQKCGTVFSISRYRSLY